MSRTMRNSSPDDDSACRLAKVVPVLRGVLAEPTDNEDIPYAPAILRSLTSPGAVEFADSPNSAKAARYPEGLNKGKNPPLYVDEISQSDTPEQLRRELGDLVSTCAKQHGSKPRIVCIRGLGVVYAIESEADQTLPLRNKVALVTGAAGAIGYGVCRGLLEKGAHVVATDLPGERLDSFTADLKEAGGDRVLGVPMDVTDKESILRGLQSIILAWGGIDIVVVNAGIAMVSRLKDMELEAFQKVEKVNVEGTLLTLRETAKHLITQGIGGDIVIMSTKNVPCPGAGFGAYSATKAACHQLGRIASIELAEYGIRVNMVAPDAVFSEGTYSSGLWDEVGPDRMKARGLNKEQLHEYYRSRNLLKSKVTGRHVANAVLFFVTRQTPTTGATIPVDGGLPDATPR